MLVKRLGVGDEILARQAISRLKMETPRDIMDDLEVEYLRHFLKGNNNYMIVAMIDEVPVGFVLAYRLMRIDRRQDMMLFYEVVVDEQYRHRGLGRELICQLKQICRDNKIMKMWVSTNRSNRAAVELYRATGAVESKNGDEISFTYLPPYE